MKKYSLILLFSSLGIGLSILPSGYGQDDVLKTIAKCQSNCISFN
jgi:hypothetical protein